MFSKIRNSFQTKISPYKLTTPQKDEQSFGKSANIDVMASLEMQGNTNRINIMKTNFELGLTSKELEKRVDKDYLSKITLLDDTSPEYLKLKDGDKKALAHLVKAANILNDVYLKQDNPSNIEFRNFLIKESDKGNKDAKNALTLFNAQKGMSALDTQSDMINLLKGNSPKAGKGVYPQDLSKEEFQEILIGMLENGKADEVKKILSQRCVVERSGNELKGIDYTEAYSKEFKAAADEIEKASEVSTNKDFNEFLKLQAQALRQNDNNIDAKADIKWAELQDTPLEFTISRENYEDELTGCVLENEKLAGLLKKFNIEPVPKDFIGIRVGIINKKGTDFLLKFKDYLPTLAQEMPFNDEYTQSVTENSDIKQTMVDVDLVTVMGDSGNYRGSITLAQNLPNSDKPAIALGGGRRNAYHRQIRLSYNPEKMQKRLNAILDKSQHALYSLEADHWFTIGHENAHSLGPAEKSTLGVYKSIIEENKADMASLSFVDKLTEMGVYNEQQRKEILVTACVDMFPKAKPEMSQAHRVRAVMQANYLMNNGAVEITNDGKIKVNTEKVVPAAKKMLAEIIRLQLSGSVDDAKAYIDKNFIWDERMETIAQALQKVNKTLNGQVVAPLADKLAKI